MDVLVHSTTNASAVNHLCPCQFIKTTRGELKSCNSIRHSTNIDVITDIQAIHFVLHRPSTSVNARSPQAPGFSILLSVWSRLVKAATAPLHPPAIGVRSAVSMFSAITCAGVDACSGAGKLELHEHAYEKHLFQKHEFLLGKS